MRICGIELKANNLIFSIIDTSSEGIIYQDIKLKKLTLNDDENMQDIIDFSDEIKNIIKEYSIEKIAIKKRAKKGNFGGGAVTFKMESIIQLNGLCNVELISAQAISRFEKKNDIEFPPSLNKYQEQSYLTALVCN